MTVKVDAQGRSARLKPIWSYFGYDEANYTTTPEGEELLRTLTSTQASQVHVRTHFLFNSGDGTPSLKWGSTNLYTEDAAGTPLYDFTIIDNIMDSTTDSGALPLFELGFMPRELSSHPEPYENSGTFVLDSGAFYPPSDYAKWAELVTVWAEHVNERYEGSGSQTNWLWELWNEPDIGYFKGTVADYARLYDHTEAALHAVFPDAMLGGPAVASPEREFLLDFLNHCASGTNAVTGQTGTRLDMVTFHAKGGVTRVNDHVQMDLGNQLRIHRMGFETIRGSAFAETPVMITEADPDGCAACSSTTHRYLDYRNSPAYGAYEIAMMKRSLDLADDVQVDLRGVLTWAFTYPGSPYFWGQRALTTNGIDLPVLNAFKLLGGLSGVRLPVTSTGARPLSDALERGFRDEPDIDALATVEGDQVQVLVWHYHDDLVDAEPATVRLEVAVPNAFGRAIRIAHQRVDEAHGNAFTVWKSQGSPEAPSAEQLGLLHEAMGSLEFEPARTVAAEGTTVSLEFQLPRFGISLLTLTPGSDSDLAPDQTGACSCRFAPSRGTSGPLSLAILVGLAVLGRRSAKHLN